MRLLEAYCLTLILPAVAYLPPLDEQHGMLRSELHSNTSDGVLDVISHVSTAVGGVAGNDPDATLRKTSEALKRDRLAVAELLKGDAKVGASGGASGNVSCSCSGEALTKMTCTCTPAAHLDAKNGSTTSAANKNASTVSKNETAKPPPVPLENTVAAFSPLAAPLASDVKVSPLAAPVEPVSFLSLRSLFSIRPAPPPSSSLVEDVEPSVRAQRRYELKRSLLWDALSSGMTIPSHHDMPASRSLSLIEFVNHTQAHRMMGITIPIAVIGTLFLVAVQLGGRDDRLSKF